jgi:hypothetical protein
LILKERNPDVQWKGDRLGLRANINAFEVEVKHLVLPGVATSFLGVAAGNLVTILSD